MRRIAVPVVILLAIGCNRSSTEAKNQTASYSFEGYNIAFEFPEGTDHKTEGKREDDGKGHVTENITVSCGKQILRIVNGKMTLNDADRGSVKPGDSIKLSSAGKVSVNQQPRGD